MDENEDANKPKLEKPTPEVAQLLKILEVQSAARRGRHAPSLFQVPAFRYGILVVIVVLTFGSLALLEWFLSQLPRPAHSSPLASPAQSTPAAS
jgi:hypothetical protein